VNYMLSTIEKRPGPDKNYSAQIFTPMNKPQSANNVELMANLIQQKTGTPVQFEIAKKTQASLQKWISFK